MNVAVYLDGIQYIAPDEVFDCTIGPISEQAGYAFVQAQERIVTELQLVDTQQGRLTITAKDKKGASTVATYTISVSDPKVATVVQDPADPSKITIVAGLPGTADIIIGPAKMPLTVIPGPAVSFEVTVDGITEQP